VNDLKVFVVGQSSGDPNEWDNETEHYLKSLQMQKRLARLVVVSQHAKSILVNQGSCVPFAQLANFSKNLRGKVRGVEC
jgi:hypothetical protein